MIFIEHYKSFLLKEGPLDEDIAGALEDLSSTLRPSDFQPEFSSTRQCLALLQPPNHEDKDVGELDVHSGLQSGNKRQRVNNCFLVFALATIDNVYNIYKER